MKKSEYRRTRTVAWSNDQDLFDETVQVLVNRDVDAVEAAGYEWEPEEPELPKRLYVIWDTASIPYLSPSGEGGPFGTDERRDASYLAAAMAYNILPQIERAFRRWQKAEYGDTSADCTFSTELNDLFTGDKEGA